MSAILRFGARYGFLGLLGLSIGSALFGGCTAGKVVTDKTRSLTTPLTPSTDRFEKK